MTNEALSADDSSDDLSDAEIWCRKCLIWQRSWTRNFGKRSSKSFYQSERAEIFRRNLENNLSAYQKDLRNKTKQTSLKDFLKPLIRNSQIVDQALT